MYPGNVPGVSNVHACMLQRHGAQALVTPRMPHHGNILLESWIREDLAEEPALYTHAVPLQFDIIAVVLCSCQPAVSQVPVLREETEVAQQVPACHNMATHLFRVARLGTQRAVTVPVLVPARSVWRPNVGAIIPNLHPSTPQRFVVRLPIQNWVVESGKGTGKSTRGLVGPDQASTLARG